MGYEVYVNVEHHPKHWGDGRRLSGCTRWEADADPDSPRAIELVADFLDQTYRFAADFLVRMKEEDRG